MTSNGLNYNIEIHIAVLNCIYGRQFDIPQFNMSNTHVAVSPEYVGIYRSNQIPLNVTVISDGDVLSIQVEGQPVIPLEADSERVFRFTENDLIAIFNPTNSTMVLIQGEEGVFYFEKE